MRISPDQGCEDITEQSLRGTCTPERTSGTALPKIISLFSGAGGLDLGFKQVGFPLAFAVDSSYSAIQTHRHNFKECVSVAADLVELGPQGVLKKVDEIIQPGQSVGVIGGPPCQGFSRANTASNPEDPRNKLPILYLEIIQTLQEKYQVEFVLFENVLGIKDAKHEITFSEIISKLEEMGLVSDVRQYSALDFGVAQTRERVIISAFRTQGMARRFAPVARCDKEVTVREAIGGLTEPAYFSRNIDKKTIPVHENHWTMRPKSKRFTQPGGATQSGRSFRRLDWDKPSPTVAYGHREIHVHPAGHRRLSIYEAMLLQGFTESFVLRGNFSDQVQQISNAVPPPLANALAKAIIKVLDDKEEEDSKKKNIGQTVSVFH